MEAIDMRETRILEFKETITNTFLKTVSAFSNYDGGTILQLCLRHSRFHHLHFHCMSQYCNEHPVHHEKADDVDG